MIQIPVMTSADVNNDRNNVRQTLINDRIAIDCQDSTSVLRKRLRFACVNSHTVRNKIAVIIDHMVDSGIDICTITETWLKDVTLSALLDYLMQDLCLDLSQDSLVEVVVHGYSVQRIVECKIQ